MRCPKWPNGGQHWWSESTVEHDSWHLSEHQYELLRDELLGPPQ